MTNTPPEGFAPHFKSSLFTNPWEPLYSKVTENHVAMGTWLRDVHCNSRGIVHGGFVSTMADNAMGLTCVEGLKSQERKVTSLVTISLNVDFVGMAKLGNWLQTESQTVKLTRSLGFIGCHLTANEDIIARATATFKIN